LTAPFAIENNRSLAVQEGPMEDVLGYEGRSVVVTGAASGMGAAAAQILVDLGAEVTGLDYKPVTVPVKTALEVDLRDRESIEKIASAIPAPVHAVFSCAGLPGPPFSGVDVMLVNFVGARQLIELLLPKMPEGSAVACIASAGGIGWQNNLENLMGLVQSGGFDEGKTWCEAHPDFTAGGMSYAVSKQAINAWVAWRAVDLIAKGIRLNCINPGPTETPMMPAFHESYTKQVVDAAMGAIGRYSKAEEQAWPLVFLNSPRMSYVTGEALFTDGGFFGAVQTGRHKFE
jgi:NAD(P)-dependent dehydrogenase (short-subunit alcohol dehydrogenase family)